MPTKSKKTTIYKSKSKFLKFFVFALLALSYTIYLFITDKTEYPKGNSFYWLGIALFGLLTSYFSYELIDNTPLYILNNDGVYSGRMKKLTLWQDLRTFECKIYYTRYQNQKLAILYDKEGKEILTIDFTSTNITIDRMTNLLSRKLRRR